MKSIINKLAILSLIFSLFSFTSIKAEEYESPIAITIQGDLVSSYVWRGMYQTSASFQPTFALSVAGFSLTAWGSTDFTGVNENSGLGAKEIDLTAAYTFRNTGLTLSVADLWWAGQGGGKYFNFKSHETAHHFEGAIAYSLPVEKFPLSIAWYTMFAGMDKNSHDEQAYSTYVELNYPFSVKMVDLNLTCGLTPWNAPQYLTNSFAVTNVALKGMTAIKFSDSFSLPIFAQAIWNPHLEDAHLVFGFTLKP